MYGNVKIDHKINVPATLEGYTKKPYYRDLKRILTALEKYRGNSNFIRLKMLPRCDMFIPHPGFAVELDESQHFTSARKLALSYYPNRLKLGYNIKKWKELCERINAKDNDPKYRDEQRAWYDTLRDFLPLIEGLEPTIRLHMADFQWCSLDVNRKKDIDFLRAKLSGNEITSKRFRSVNKKSIHIATVTIQTEGNYTNSTRTSLLSEVLKHLDKKTDVVLLPGGFYKAKNSPKTIYKDTISNIKKLMKTYSKNIPICFGIDGREGKDQFALAVSQDGIIAAGRKFHPTDNERGSIKKASHYLSEEDGYSRIFEVKGRKIFLAVCYDSFGIRQKHLKNPGVDIIFNLVHGFCPKGEGMSGEIYFAKHGFAGSSKEWKCPTFGTAVFFDREIPSRWPTGVIWNQRNKSTTYWRYESNPLKKPIRETKVLTSKEYAIIKLYRI